ncbi:MAG: hypothetical protein JWM55_1184 [Acidimicrobiaceae bacterium]|nr:hypothetical protein [Acidimicrobiaceae bacterium]
MYQKLDQTSELTTSRRRRSARALINDESIRRAAVTLILRKGIDSISFRDVGRAAGLTHGALYARCEDVEELLVDAWANELREHAESMMATACAAASCPDGQAIHDVITGIREASQSDEASVQVLLASRRFPVLREEVDGFVRSHLETSGDLSGALHARALMVFSLMATTILYNAQFGSDDQYLDFVELMLGRALKLDPQDVPSLTFHEALDRIIPTPRNDIRSHLAFETFHAVAKSGYTGATISRISRRANCSPGAIYKIYTSKDELAVAAIRSVMKAPWITTENFCSILDEGALAQLLYASASHHNDARNYFVLEVSLSSGQNAQLRAALQSQLRNLELLVPFVSGLDDAESLQLSYMIRLLTSLSLGAGFFSTVTKAISGIEFNQFAEPLRRTLKQQFPSWGEIRRQLLAQVIPQQTGQRLRASHGTFDPSALTAVKTEDALS